MPDDTPRDGEDERLVTEAPPLAPSPRLTASPLAPPDQGSTQGAGWKRMPFLDLLYGIFFNPRATMRQLLNDPPVGEAIGVFVIVTVISSAVSLAGWGARLSDQLMTFAPTAVILGGLAAGFVSWFVTAGVFGLLADMLGGRGRGIVLFTLVGLANLPRVIDAPLALLSYTPFRSLETLLSLALWVWVVVLYVIAVSESFKLPTRNAVAVVLLPVAALVVLLILVALAFAGLIATIMPYIQQNLPMLPGL